MFGKNKNKDRKPPLANVIGSKGKGGWLGLGRKRRENPQQEEDKRSSSDD